MSEALISLPANWQLRTIAELGKWSGGQTPFKSNPRYWQEGHVLWVSPKDIIGPLISDSEDKITQLALDNTRLRHYPITSVMVVVRSGILRHRFPVARCTNEFTVNQDLKVLVPNVEIDPQFVFCMLTYLGPSILRRVVKAGTTVESVDIPSFLKLKIPTPPLPQQRKIARILTTVDNLIEKTESLIAKYQAIKQGMMHDLFTRGVDEHGHLRPPYEQAPELYKQSELGWIPKEWEVGGLRVKGRSDRVFLRTGPFGSTLKAEHWVAEGVPVVTIGSLGEGAFTHSELLYISANYARMLGQYALEDGDIVFSRVADVGRSAVITNSEQGWIMSSNLMRISLDTTVAEPYFVYLAIVYSKSIKEQIRQSVNAGGREVANSNVMGGLMFAWPQIEEQRRIAKLAQSHDAESNIERDHLEKLRLLKTGLMQDLLTGKVRVKVDEAEEVAAHA